jgi:electron transfer flavoprotein beta subunit
MKVAVLVKYVPEPTASWSFAADNTLDRAAVDGRLSELDEYAVEQAVRLKESGVADEVVHVSVGPAKALDALRKALAIGGDSALHVVDDSVHGSDALGTSLVLAEALRRVGADLVLTGMASTDGEMSVVPSMVADRLGIAQGTFAGEITVDGGSVSIRRDTDVATEQVDVRLPAVVSVTDQAGEARYPAFKSIPRPSPTSGSTRRASVSVPRPSVSSRSRPPRPGRRAPSSSTRERRPDSSPSSSPDAGSSENGRRRHVHECSPRPRRDQWVHGAQEHLRAAHGGPADR